MSEEFEPHLGRIGSNKSRRSGTYLRSVLDYAYKSGMKSRRKSSFTGSRIGRGVAFGTLAGAGLVPGGQRRVIVKGRIAKLKPGNLAAARAHKPVADIKTAFNNAVDRVYLKNVSPHTLKHTAATWLMQSGKDPFKISDFLATSVPTLLKHYGHHNPDHQLEIAEAISARPENVRRMR